jgi:hypothetical protein
MFRSIEVMAGKDVKLVDGSTGVIYLAFPSVNYLRGVG